MVKLLNSAKAGSLENKIIQRYCFCYRSLISICIIILTQIICLCMIQAFLKYLYKNVKKKFTIFWKLGFKYRLGVSHWHCMHIHVPAFWSFFSPEIWYILIGRFSTKKNTSFTKIGCSLRKLCKKAPKLVKIECFSCQSGTLMGGKWGII